MCYNFHRIYPNIAEERTKAGMTNVSLFEYSVKAVSRGAHKRRRILLSAMYILLLFGCAVAFFLSKSAYILVAVLLVYFGIIMYTRRFFNLEYEFEAVSGELTVSRIFGGMSRRQMVTVSLRSFVAVSPYNEKISEKKIEAFGCAGRYDARSLAVGTDFYFALFTDGKGTASVLLFDADDRLLSALKFYNPSVYTGMRTPRV